MTAVERVLEHVMHMYIYRVFFGRRAYHMSDFLMSPDDA